jgi:hypothetical protein
MQTSLSAPVGLPVAPDDGQVISEHPLPTTITRARTKIIRVRAAKSEEAADMKTAPAKSIAGSQ